RGGKLGRALVYRRRLSAGLLSALPRLPRLLPALGSRPLPSTDSGKLSPSAVRHLTPVSWWLAGALGHPPGRCASVGSRPKQRLRKLQAFRSQSEPETGIALPYSSLQRPRKPSASSASALPAG